ncbi:hypothetical protein SAMN05443579_101615 [Variovorax sp. PDC80]|uniref:hypothetical protein n=1 Tax=Variovorax sp. PDC80 TaxID=1882827 RepID=UPI0008E30D69|nr:hypothetical protein [Variovorax sp. PDC80]SFO08115.1 hypothetical protein SAMN05443579_101615 [Variovorax sp. PDC80]
MPRSLRPFVAAVLAALVSLPAAAAGETPPRFSKDEQPLRQAVEDAAMCFHFAGEFGGDGSARDREVKREMTKVCKDESQQRVMQAYRKNPRDRRLYPAVLMLDGMVKGPALTEAEKARLCAVAKTELVCP